MSADANNPSPGQVNPADAEALRGVSVEMVAVPTKPEPLADPLLQKIGTWLGGSRFWAKCIFFIRGTEVVTVLNEALRREEQRLTALESFDRKIYRNIGEAWKEAGKPRLAGLNSIPEEADPKEVEKEQAAIRRLDERHSSLSRMSAKRQESMDAEMERRKERLQQSAAAVEVINGAVNQLAMEGSLALQQVLDDLPQDLRRSLQRASFGEVRDDLDALRTDLEEKIVQMQDGLTRASQDKELLIEEAVLAEAEVKNMRAELNRRALDRERGLDESLGQIGKELVGRLALFHNGEYVITAVRDGKKLLEVTRKRLEGLNRAFKMVNDMTGGLVLNRGIVVGVATAVVVALSLWGIKMSIEAGVWDSQQGIGGLHTWELPDSVDMYGEIRVEEVKSFVPLIRTLNQVRKAAAKNPAANLLWESETKLDRETVLGFAGVLSDRSMVTVGPFADQVERITTFWQGRGLKISDREASGETIKRLDYLRAFYADSDGRLLQGDPDLLADIMATRSRDLDSVEATESFDVLSPAVTGMGCAWLILNRTEKSARITTLLSPFGLSQMPASIGVDMYCTRPFRVRVLLQFAAGGGIQAGSELNQAFSGSGGVGALALVRDAADGMHIGSNEELVTVELSLKNDSVSSLMTTLF